MQYLLSFGSTHKALRAEGVLREAGVVFRLLPAPKALSRYCDLVISVDASELDRARLALGAADSGARATYRREGESYVEV